MSGTVVDVDQPGADAPACDGLLAARDRRGCIARRRRHPRRRHRGAQRAPAGRDRLRRGRRCSSSAGARSRCVRSGRMLAARRRRRQRRRRRRLADGQDLGHLVRRRPRRAESIQFADGAAAGARRGRRPGRARRADRAHLAGTASPPPAPFAVRRGRRRRHGARPLRHGLRRHPQPRRRPRRRPPRRPRRHDHDDGHDDGHDDTAAPPTGPPPPTTAGAAIAAKPYDPTLPIDLGGVDGVTPEQQARAENLIAITLIRLPQFADYQRGRGRGLPLDRRRRHRPRALHQLGLPSTTARSSTPTTPSRSSTSRSRTARRKLVVGDVHARAGRRRSTTCPTSAAPLTQWHIHDNLCFTDDPRRRRSARAHAAGGGSAGRRLQAFDAGAR